MLPTRVAPPLPPTRQLALPLDVGVSHLNLGVFGAPVAPRRVWRGLTEALRQHVQQELLRICQEISHDAGHHR